jgi:hypothetical protein
VIQIVMRSQLAISASKFESKMIGGDLLPLNECQAVIERDRERMTVNQTVSSRFPAHRNFEGVSKIDPKFQSY